MNITQCISSSLLWHCKISEDLRSHEEFQICSNVFEELEFDVWGWRCNGSS